MAAAPSSSAGPPLRAAALAGAGAVLLAVVYPVVLGAAEERFGARGLALGLLAVAALWLPLRGPARGARRLAAVGLASLLALAAATDDARWLRGVPAGIYVGLAALFAASLRGGGSILESVACRLVPEAPDFIRGYCRVVTALWVAFFAVSATAIGWLAVAADAAAWRAVTSRDVWLAMLAFTGIEFLVRKSWFRYYFHGGPFDRLWSRLFPAERTARGRRSQQYIAEFRARQADAARAEPSAET